MKFWTVLLMSLMMFGVSGCGSWIRIGSKPAWVKDPNCVYECSVRGSNCRAVAPVDTNCYTSSSGIHCSTSKNGFAVLACAIGVGVCKSRCPKVLGRVGVYKWKSRKKSKNAFTKCKTFRGRKWKCPKKPKNCFSKECMLVPFNKKSPLTFDTIRPEGL